MRRAAVLLLTTVLLAGCAAVDGAVGQAQDVLGEARDTVGQVKANIDDAVATLRWCTSTFRLATAVAARDAEAAGDAAERLRATAPPELDGDLTLLVDAIARAEADGLGALATEEVRAAADRVLAYARERCDPSAEASAAAG